MRSCIKIIYPGGLGVFVWLLCLGAVLPPAAVGSIPSSAIVEPYAPPATWGADLDEAIGNARISLKPMLVLFTAPDCPACDQISRFSLANAVLQPLIRTFERVEIDLSKRPELVTLFGIEKIPALYIIDPDGRVKGHLEGYVTAKALKKYLENFLTRDWSPLEIDRLIATLASGRASADQWHKALSAMDISDIRGRILDMAGRLSPGDIKILSACLGDKQLAVRLGALDLLEEVNDTIIGFDPWADSDSSGQQDLLGQWLRWADAGQGPSATAVELTRDKFDRHLQNLIGDDPQRSRRALQALVRGGQRAARLIEDYFQTHPALDTRALRRIKEVQYALSIPSAGGLDPQATAHRIVWGNQDVRIRTIRQLADCGAEPSAILIDLLANRDPLVRETAVEILFKAVGPLAVAPVKKLLQQEKDPDVCFAVLKHLGDTNTVESQRILQSYFTHDNEDLVIAAIEGAVKSSAGSLATELLPLLEDPRWRVRVAALEGIKKKGGTESGFIDRLRGKQLKVPDSVSKALCKCLNDPDEFVRHTAAVTLGHLKIGDAEGPLKTAYEQYPDIRGVVVTVLMAMGRSIPSSYTDALFGSQPDDLLYVLDSIEEINRGSRKLIQRAAASENPDIACSALRIIAGSEKRKASDNALLISALNSGKTEKQLTVIQEFDLDSDDIAHVRTVMKNRGLSEKNSTRRSGNTDADVLSAVAGLMDTPPGTAPAVPDLVSSNAMILLVKFGYGHAFSKALETWPELTASMRTTVARSLSLFGQEAIPLFKRALDDDFTDVWEAALNQVTDDQGRQWFAGPLADYLLDPAVRLTPSMMWTEGLHSLCMEDPRLLAPYARKILSAPGSFAPDRLILALTVYALSGVPESEQPSILALTKEKDPLIRRAAWIALIAARGREELEKQFETIRADPSRYVRVLIPTMLYNNVYDKTQVTLYFSEEVYFSSYRGLRIDFEKASVHTYDTEKPEEFFREKTLNPAVIEKVKSMTADEPDAMVRFRCMLCLLSYKTPLDLNEVYTTARLANNPKMVAELLGEFFSTHLPELGESFRVLLPLLQTSDDYNMYEYVIESFINRWGGRDHIPDDDRTSPVSSEDPSSSQPLVAGFTEGHSEIPMRIDSPVEVAVFTTLGCRRCFIIEKVIQLLNYPYRNLHVHRHDILTSQGLAYNEALSRKFRADDTDHATAPAVFMAGGYLTDRDITFFSLEKLVSLSLTDYDVKDALAVSPEELAAADGFIRERRKQFSWYGMGRAGLLKGFDPLSLAALLLVLYYLCCAGRIGLSVMRYGALYMVTAVSFALTMWLAPLGGIAKGTYLHDVGGVFFWLIFLYLIFIALRLFFRSLWRLRKKVKSKADHPKKRKIPSRRYVVGVVILWTVILSLFDILSLGNARTVTLAYSIKNQISPFPSIVMLILFCTMAMLPSAGILWGVCQLTRNAKARSFFTCHQFVTHMTLSAIWIWMVVKYFQAF